MKNEADNERGPQRDQRQGVESRTSQDKGSEGLHGDPSSDAADLDSKGDPQRGGKLAGADRSRTASADAPRAGDKRSDEERGDPSRDDDEMDGKGDPQRSTKPAQADRSRTASANAPRVEHDQQRKQGR